MLFGLLLKNMRTFLVRYGELPRVHHLVTIFLFLSGSAAFAGSLSLKQSCLNYLTAYPSYFKEEVLDQICEKVEQSNGCSSKNGEPIFHADFKSKKPAAKKILVISLIHGDENQAGDLARFWLERLAKVDARNTWRIIPVVNPDGVKAKTRMNANGIDLNRNFPTVDWTAESIKFWEREAKKSPRKFPGYAAASEVETQCIMKHLEEYKPDFVISIHTPLRVLDFDGPKLAKKVRYDYLPWRSLGNFPGSLGRYLWVERQTPVLTTELRNSLPSTQVPFEQLQDIIGTLVKTDLK